jgi:hypothetical protein
VKKVQVYGVIGWILLAVGLITACIVLVFGQERGLRDGVRPDFPGLSEVLMVSVFNVPLWVGLVMLWRADKNENPARKSKWLTVIKIFLVFSSIVVAILIGITVLILTLIRF